MLKKGTKLSMGMVVGIILMLATGAMADEFKSWRTANGEVIARASNEFLQQGNPKSATFSALCPLIAPPVKLLQAINMANAGDKSQLGLIIDVRPKSEYLAGHIPYAVWIADWFDMAKPENLDKVDAALAAHIAAGGANKVIVYCHTGHKGGYVAGALGALGYAAHNLKFGYKIGWLGDTSALHAADGMLPLTGPIDYTAMVIE